jgi:hypothetical protein
MSAESSKRQEKLNWKTSIVDLMKVLDLDSSLRNRQELAKELGYSGDLNDSVKMTIWLHKQVMTQLAENGGIVPEGLKQRQRHVEVGKNQRNLFESNAPQGALGPITTLVSRSQSLIDVGTAFVVVVAAYLVGLSTEILPDGVRFGSASWSAMFIGLASICLGFGAATLVYRRSRAKQSETLRAIYEQLGSRADRLLDELQPGRERR